MAIANVTVSTTLSNITVSETPINLTVSSDDSNITVQNSSSNISVINTESNVTFSAVVSDIALIRSAFNDGLGIEINRSNGNINQKLNSDLQVVSSVDGNVVSVYGTAKAVNGASLPGGMTSRTTNAFVMTNSVGNANVDNGNIIFNGAGSGSHYGVFTESNIEGKFNFIRHPGTQHNSEIRIGKHVQPPLYSSFDTSPFGISIPPANTDFGIGTVAMAIDGGNVALHNSILTLTGSGHIDTPNVSSNTIYAVGYYSNASSGNIELFANTTVKSTGGAKNFVVEQGNANIAGSGTPGLNEGGNVHAKNIILSQTTMANGSLRAGNVHANVVHANYYYGDASNLTGIAGDIESVTAGSGLTGGGTSGDVTLNVGAGYGITVNADSVEITNSEIQAQANVALGNNTTTNLAEGTNLYFTNARANTVIGTNTTDNLTEGTTNLYYTSARANTDVVNHIATVPLTVGGNLVAGINATSLSTFTGNAFISGNLTVGGNIDYVQSQDLLVKDQSITLNVGNVAQDAMIIVDRAGSGAGSNVDLKWNETTDKWTFTNDGSTYYNIPASTSDLAEGTNLYFTNTRADARVNLQTGTNLDLSSKTTSNLAEGTNLYFTNARSRAAISSSTSSSSGGGALAYDSGTGVFTFAPADLSSLISLGSLSTTTASASGGGSLAYDNTSGVFTFAPAVPGIQLNALSVTQASASGTGALAYNNGSGVFTYTPPDLSATGLTNAQAQAFIQSSGLTMTADITSSNLIKTTGNLQVNADADISGLSGLTFDSATNNLGLGTTTPKAALHIRGTSNESQIYMTEFNGTSSAGIDLRTFRAGGTEASPTVTPKNDRIWERLHYAYDGSGSSGDGITTGFQTAFAEQILTDDTIDHAADTVPVMWQLYNYLDGDATTTPHALIRARANGDIQFNSGSAFSQTGAANTVISNSGNVTTTGNISGSYIKGNGSELTGVVALTDLSTTTASASSGGALAYDNSSGVFTFTPAVPGIGLTALSVSQASASGTGALAYNNSSGVFTYTPPDLSGATLTNAQVQAFIQTGGLAMTANVTSNSLISTTGNLQVNADTTSAIGMKGLTYRSDFNLLGLGTTSPQTALHINCDGNQFAAVRLDEYADTFFGPDVSTFKARGSLASPTAVSAGDRLLELKPSGYTGSGFLNSMGQMMFVDNANAINSTTMPIGFSWEGYKDGDLSGSTSYTSLMKLRANGEFQIGALGFSANNNEPNFAVTHSGDVNIKGSTTFTNANIINGEISTISNVNINTGVGSVAANANVAVTLAVGNSNAGINTDLQAFTGGQIFADGTQITNNSFASSPWSGYNGNVYFLKYNSGQGAYELWNDAGFSSAVLIGGGSFTGSGDSGQAEYVSSTSFPVGGNLNIGGSNVVVQSLGGNVTTVGNISGNYFIGNGSLLTGVVGGGGISNAQAQSFIQSSGLSMTANIDSTKSINFTYPDTVSEGLKFVSDTGSSGVSILDVTSARSGDGGPQNIYRKATGTIASPGALGTRDYVRREKFFGHDGTQYLETMGTMVYQDSDVGGVSTDVVPLAYEIYTEQGGDVNHGFNQSIVRFDSDRNIIFNDTGTRTFGNGNGNANIKMDGSFNTVSSITAAGNITTDLNLTANTILPKTGANVHIDTVKPVTSLGNFKIQGNVVIDRADFTASGSATNAITAIISHGNQGGSGTADSIILTTELPNGTLVTVSGITDSGATEVNNQQFYIKQEGSLGFGALGVGLFTDSSATNPVRLMTTNSFIGSPSGSPIATYAAGSFIDVKDANLEIKGHTLANTLTATGNLLVEHTVVGTPRFTRVSGANVDIHTSGNPTINLLRGTEGTNVPTFIRTDQTGATSGDKGVALVTNAPTIQFNIGSAEDKTTGLQIYTAGNPVQLLHTGAGDEWQLNTKADQTFYRITTTDDFGRLDTLTTTQINALSSPATGQMVFNTTLGQVCVYDSSAWQKLTQSAM